MYGLNESQLGAGLEIKSQAGPSPSESRPGFDFFSGSVEWFLAFVSGIRLWH